METSWKHFNVHYKFKDNDTRRKLCMTALDKEDAKLTFESYARNDDGNGMNIPFGAVVIKVIGPLGRETTPKQKLAQSYAFVLGGIKGSYVMMNRNSQAMKDIAAANPKIADRMARAWALVDAQYMKLQRDIRDLYKLSGLNIK